MKRLLLWILIIILPVIPVYVGIKRALLLFLDHVQTKGEVEFAFFLSNIQLALSIIISLSILVTGYILWKKTESIFAKVLLLFVGFVGVSLSLVSIINPISLYIKQPANGGTYVLANKVEYMDDDDVVMGVDINGENKAYPLKFMNYHHLVNDKVGGEPVLISYCISCRSGMVFSPVIEGETASFEMMGVNNQNFIMKDSQTGTWWQQTTGVGLHGKLSGSELKVIDHEQVSWKTWREEHPETKLLRPDSSKLEQYKTDWVKASSKLLVSTPRKEIDPLEEVLRVEVNGHALAYPLALLREKQLLLDSTSGKSLLILASKDGKGFRVYNRQLGEETLDFIIGLEKYEITDINTGSSWGFDGKAFDGELTGAMLNRMPVKISRWFDLTTYETSVDLRQ